MTTLRKFLGAVVLATLVTCLPAASFAGIKGHKGTSPNPVFNLTAKEGHISTADASSYLFWGFADDDGQDGGKIPGQVQFPGPTLIVTEGDTVTINLTNTLAEPVSLIFPGLDVLTSTAPVFRQGNPAMLTSLTPEAAPGGKQVYRFIASRPGTFYYQSGSNQDIQIRMGLFGGIIVRPLENGTTKTYTKIYPDHADRNGANPGPDGPAIDFTKFVYDEDNVPDLIPILDPTAATGTTMTNIGASTGYDREFLYLVSDMDPDFEIWMELKADRTKPVSLADWIDASIKKDFTQWKANYWFATGRTAPDDMGEDFDKNLISQPYSIQPLMHPGESLLTRFVNMGRDFHPLHTHGQHQRIVGEDGMILSSSPDPFAPDQTGPTGTKTLGADISQEEFTLTLSPGNTFDSIFTWTGKKLGWDLYGHNPGDALAPYEYIGDHVIASAAPMVPDPLYGRYPTNQYAPLLADSSAATTPQAGPTIFAPEQLTFTFGPWFSGSPFLGDVQPLPPSNEGSSFNLGGGYYYMWHSHAEREITNYNIFPGGMLTMMGIVPWPATGQTDLLPPEPTY
jgi:FtsP/CotA-like multicopper oxidase with cupredoxin domain